MKKVFWRAFAVLVLPVAASAQDIPISQRYDAQLADLQAEVSYRIVGGQLAAEGAWPWQVLTYRRMENGTAVVWCGGSVIHERWVLTAAHCIKSKDRNDYFVVEGTNRVDNPLRANGRGRLLKVKRVIAHEGYVAQTTENDIALLELETPAKSRAITLPLGASTLEEPGRMSTVTGWGTLRAIRNGKDVITQEAVRPNDPRYFTDRLMEVEVPLVSEEVCREAYRGSSGKIDGRVLCAGLQQGGRDSCQGDSGGPMVTKSHDGLYQQIGIVSFGKGCGQKDGYGVYSRVSAFGDWLRSNTGLSFDASVPADPMPAPGAVPGSLPSGQPAPPALAVNNSAGISVSFAQGDQLKVDEITQFRVVSKTAGYLLLVDITPDGKMTQIFPNARSLSSPLRSRARSNYVQANSPTLIPDPQNPYEGYDIKVEPPIGEGLLVAILSEKPLQSVPLPDVPKTMDRPEALEYFSKLTGELSRDLQVGASFDRPGWSFAVQPYRIVQ
ncbi:putative serine protease [Bradyrhizobiaceae bacterium SG-6C]|nr:putative serine protease [Bradyrhizobiaceae bacterium SG-6C]